jgi:GTP-binding protein EngB required for normal cell division
MLEFLADIEAPTVVVLTKIDKLKPRQIAERVRALSISLQLDEDQMIPFSAETNAGRDDLAEAVVALVGQPSWRAAPAMESEPEAGPGPAPEESE